MASANSLAGLMKFLDRAEWQAGFNDVLARHLAPPCAETDIAIDELADLVGDHHASVLWGCAFEDFLTCDLDDGRNIVDDYLKRRGWKESVANKANISALRSSVMSLYEISDIVHEESFLARDLVQGGEPVRVSERSGTRYLKPWDRMATRLVHVGSRIEMAGGALPFDYDTSETLLKTLRRMKKTAHAEVRKSARKRMQGIDGAFPDALVDTALLHASAFLFTNIWFDDFLQRTLNPTLPQTFNTDGDEILFTTASFPLKPEASADAVRLALAAVPELRPESETFWNWIGAKERAGKKRQVNSGSEIRLMDSPRERSELLNHHTSGNCLNPLAERLPAPAPD